MFHALPVSVTMQPWLCGALQATLPGGDYMLPATLQPMLLFVLHGSIAMRLNDGSWQTLAAAGLCGATASIRHCRATAGTRIVTYGVPPAKLPGLLGLAASEAFEHYLPLSQLLPARLRPTWLNAVGEANASSANALLLQLLQLHGHRQDSLCLPARWQQYTAPQLAACCGLGLRQFERRFRLCHGQSWRAYRHQHRCQQLLLQLCGRAQPPHWASLAGDHDYGDQAHLHRDLLRFTGYTPGRFARALRQHDPALWLYRPSPQLLAPLLGEGSGGRVVSLQD